MRYTKESIKKIVKDNIDRIPNMPAKNWWVIYAKPNGLPSTNTICRHYIRWNDFLEECWGGINAASPKPPILCNCKKCNILFYKRPSQISSNNFCSQSCAATYTNQHKTHGTRISKLELWLQQQLTTLYPHLEFHFNRKDAINSELDIYIPSMKLAFELNGIFHYEPIYGEEKLKQIINNDTRKFAACQEAGISLCIIDTSSQEYVKPKTSQKFLDIIVDIINNKVP